MIHQPLKIQPIRNTKKLNNKYPKNKKATQIEWLFY